MFLKGALPRILADFVLGNLKIIVHLQRSSRAPAKHPYLSEIGKSTEPRKFGYDVSVLRGRGRSDVLFLDIRHPYYVQLTADKTRYPLTIIT